jgi:uncharacterized membrane protein YuzA (DUF378 family)
MFHKFALLLVIVGSINMGLVAMLHVDLFVTMFDGLSHIVSVLVGISGVYLALTTYTTLLKKHA